MDFLKALFESGALTWEEFTAKVNEKGFKIADLSKGNYVAKKKYEDDLNAKDTTITDLNSQIATRDTDIAGLKKQLEDGSKDSETKVSELTSQVTKLQSDYEAAKNDYEAKLQKQTYEFAVREFASGQKFSSNAAKRDFINEMISAELKMQDKEILGATDFVDKYKKTNSDAFVVEDPKQDQPTPDPNQVGSKPFFVQPTPPAPTPDANPFNFGFAGVR